MELKKEKLEGMRLVAKPDFKQNYEWDIIVPDSKPDILKIVNTEGFITVNSKEVMNDRAVINCNVRINIIYISADDGNCIKNVECVQTTNYVMELKELKPSMKLCVDVSIDKIFANIINSRKLNINCNVCYIGEAYEKYEAEYIDCIENSNLEFKCKTVDGLKMLDCIEDKFSVNDEIEIPSGKSSAESIIAIKPEFTHIDIKNANGKFVIRGNLNVASVYDSIADSDGIQYMVTETPINEIVECGNINEDNILDCDVNVCNFNYILKENSDGEKRIIKYTCDVYISGKVYEKISIHPVIDIYSISDEIKMNSEKCLLDKYEKVEAGQFWVKDIIHIDNKKDIQRIISTDAKVYTDKITKGIDRLNLNGHINVDILYQSIDGELCHVKYELPFGHTIDNSYDYPVYDVKTQVESSSYNIISSDSVEMRINVGYKVKVENKVELDFVKNIEITGKKNMCKKGISIVFCDGNEVLWDIAKKYRTTVEEILSVNELETENDIVKGMKLLIP